MNPSKQDTHEYIHIGTCTYTYTNTQTYTHVPCWEPPIPLPVDDGGDIGSVLRYVTSVDIEEELVCKWLPPLVVIPLLVVAVEISPELKTQYA